MNKINSLLTKPLIQTLVWMILFGSIFIVFYIALKNEFVFWDDPRYVYQNKLMLETDFESFKALFKSIVLLNYHPITMLSLWLNVKIFGMVAKPIIIVNILLHLANSYLIFRLAEKLIPNAILSIIIAIFWALHPMHVEAVVWVSARKDVLYTCFYLISLLLLLKSELKSIKLLCTSLFFFVLCCFSKAMGITMPVCYFLIVYFFRKNESISLKSLLPLLPFFIISIITFAISINTLSQGDLGGFLVKNDIAQNVTNFQFSFIERLAYVSLSLVIYVAKLFVPYNLHHWYLYPIFTPYYYFFIAAVLISGWLIYKSKNSILQFGSVFFILQLILVLQLFPNSVAFMAERYTYLSYFGIIFSIIHLISRFKVAVLGLIILPIFTFFSIQHIKTWRNNYSLWKQTHKQYPTDYKVVKSFLTYILERNNDDEALDVLNNCISQDVLYPDLFFTKSSIELKQQNILEAEKSINQCIAYINNDNDFKQKNIATVYLTKAAILDQLGKQDSALFYMQKGRFLLIK